MGQYWYALLLAPLILTQAQAQLGPSTSPAGLVSSPSPEWLVWRAFHGSLVYYSSRAPDELYSMLKLRAGLSEQDVHVVLDLGEHYLEQLSTIDREANREVEAKRAALGRPEETLQLHLQRNGEQLDGSTRIRVDRRQLLEDALAADGVPQRMELERQSTIRNHRESLSRAIGSAKLAVVERFIANEVAPNVVSLAAPTIPFRREFLGELE